MVGVFESVRLFLEWDVLLKFGENQYIRFFEVEVFRKVTAWNYQDEVESIMLK